jgi:hypothetical protein
MTTVSAVAYDREILSPPSVGVKSFCQKFILGSIAVRFFPVWLWSIMSTFGLFSAVAEQVLPRSAYAPYRNEVMNHLCVI